MNTQEKQELYDRAEKLELDLWDAVLAKLSPQGQSILQLYSTIALFTSILGRTTRANPAFDRAVAWGVLQRETGAAEGLLIAA